jgi:serine protease
MKIRSRFIERIPIAVKQRLRLGRTAILLLPTTLLINACYTKPMTLSWQDTSENEDGFRIYRIYNNEKVFIAQVGPNITQYTDKAAPPGACYIVTAYNAAGESASTNSACKTP